MILREIAQKTLERVEVEKRKKSLDFIKKEAKEVECHKEFPFYNALAKDSLSFICEVKKASPSKGVLAKDFPYVQIATEYEEAGADAISVLTEPFYFQGSDQYLMEIEKKVNIPLLRKDFTVDEYMIYEAKIMRASAILLICSILSPQQLREYHEIAEELGLSVLVEAHDEKEVEMALNAKAKIIGVNNRNLNTFEVDIQNSIRLRKMVPSDILYVSESGIKTPADIKDLVDNGTNGVLIGETFMVSNNKKEVLNQLRGV